MEQSNQNRQAEKKKKDLEETENAGNRGKAKINRCELPLMFSERYAIHKLRTDGFF